MDAVKRHRESELDQWARACLAEYTGLVVDDSFELVPASDDASFRRYFRGAVGDRSYIFVDAPPDKEDSSPFVDVSRRLLAGGLNVPAVYRHDLTKGFMMLTDLGDRLYLDEVVSGDEGRVESLYDNAVRAIATMQSSVDATGLPGYDEPLLREEMNLFIDWFLPLQLGIETNAVESALIEDVFRRMVENALSQPTAFVHRDYHSRNLMVMNERNPGIVDFQDAVSGPVTYDLVSLLKDCYHRFSPAFVRERATAFKEHLAREGFIDAIDDETYRRWFDFMGMQRHIKVAGIFSRLNIRDGKPRYLGDIPLVVDYILEVCDRYDELQAFDGWLRARVLPAMDTMLERPRR